MNIVYSMNAFKIKFGVFQLERYREKKEKRPEHCLTLVCGGARD